MNEYRIIFKYKDKLKSKVISATDAADARNIFIKKIKPDALQELKIIDARPVAPETCNFSFNCETAATFLQWYLEQADADEYDFSCTMDGKKPDENAKEQLQAMQEFCKNHFMTKIKIEITGDKY